MKKELTVKEVMAYAKSKYEEGGSCIVDHYDEDYIEELIEEGHTLEDFKEIITDHRIAWGL